MATRILVIDDNNNIRENTAEILSLAGFDVTTAENGKQGVETAAKELPELIVCDIMMPELDGYGVLHLLKRNPQTAHIPFIFLTAKTERTDLRKGMEMGADDYITKPFDDIELLNAIEARLKKNAIIQAKYTNGEAGANELMKDLSDSGVLLLDPSQYTVEHFTKKSNVYIEGRRPKYLYQLNSGKVKTFRMNDNGKEYITNLYHAGDYLGYLPLLEDKPSEETAEVLEDADITLISKDDFLHAVYNDPGIAAKFIRIFSKDVAEKEDRMLQLAYDSLRMRVAKGLIAIHQKFNRAAGNNGTIAFSREDLAQYVGTATESLIRTLSDFKSEKLIEINNGKITIAEPGKLQKLLY